jgi:3-hydroxyisobutyrate dehydrogenase-like beta-hydroxyacid dehydrogenase
METIDPEVAPAVAVSLAEKNIEMLDARVSGGPDGTQQATLSIMVGGKLKTFARVKPLLECLGKTIVHGEPWRGSTTKACNQLALFVAAEGAAEALALTRAKARTTCPR